MLERVTSRWAQNAKGTIVTTRLEKKEPRVECPCRIRILHQILILIDILGRTQIRKQNEKKTEKCPCKIILLHSTLRTLV